MQSNNEEKKCGCHCHRFGTEHMKLCTHGECFHCQPLYDSNVQEMHNGLLEPQNEAKMRGLSKLDGCGICGGELVLIRGRYPGSDKRKVCPTCLMERLEQIQDISSPNYGQAYSNSTSHDNP